MRYIHWLYEIYPCPHVSVLLVQNHLEHIDLCLLCSQTLPAHRCPADISLPRLTLQVQGVSRLWSLHPISTREGIFLWPALLFFGARPSFLVKTFIFWALYTFLLALFLSWPLREGPRVLAGVSKARILKLERLVCLWGNIGVPSRWGLGLPSVPFGRREAET